MKKILSIITILTVLTFAFTGCGNKSQSSSTQSTSTTESSNSKTNTQSSNASKKTPDLSGEVTAISGTEITLKLIEVPTAGGDKNATSTDGQNKDQSTTTDGQSKDKTPPADGQNKDKTPPTEGQKPKMEIKYTGETKTLKLADGVSITTMVKNEQSGAQQSGTHQGGTEKTLAVKDIKVGDRLNVWYTDSNKTTISKVSVLNVPTAKN
ncbi:hypothetical protein [Clostridium thailandense]|uniref:hypothetical protein n=1 Tax=Clostridium thailandense TaxID=2794346 RepID=UPI0039893386